MPAQAREEVRTFLGFDMTSLKDIFVHDQLSWGIIESIKEGGPVIIMRKTTLVNLHDSVQDESVDDIRHGTRSTRFNLKSGELTDRGSIVSSRTAASMRPTSAHPSAGRGGAGGGGGRNSSSNTNVPKTVKAGSVC